jgi:hypothetical protein
MGFAAREIEYLLVKAAEGDIIFEAKTGEDPEYKLKIGSIESTADGMTNTGQLILKHMSERTYISGVFAYDGDALDELQTTIDDAKTNPNPEIPVHAVMTDGTIYSNTGIFAGPIVADGPGTATLRFESALDFVES